MDLRSLSEDAPESQWSPCATRSVPSTPAGPSRHNADRRIRWWSDGQRSAPSGSRRAATGVRNTQRVCSETVEDHDRRPGIGGPLTWRSSHAFTVLNHNPAGQSVASVKPAALAAGWGRAGAANRPWKGARRRLGSGCRSWSTVRATPRLPGNTCTPGGASSLLGVQLQSPTGALAERLAQLLAGDEPELGGGRVAQP
jgi:hypothetical protein